MTEAAKGTVRSSSSARTQSKMIGRLVAYRITELFGIFNYDFDLDAGGITLITGVNGTGKSTILRTIDLISTGNWSPLLEIQFKMLTLGFDSGRELSVTRTKSQIDIALTGEDTWSIPNSLASGRGISRRYEGREILREQQALMYRYEELSRLERNADARREPELLNELAYLRARIRDLSPMPAWIGQLSQIFPVLFITDQRLIVERPRKRSEQESAERVPTRVAADEAAREISQQISIAKSAYANRAQVLDRDLPQRVVKALSRPTRVGELTLRQRLDELTQQSKDLESVGLSPTESVGEFEDLDLTTGNIRAFIKVYIEDARTKLSVLEPLRIKLQLFAEFLRQHYGRKYIQISPDRGFIIRLSGEADSELQPSKLSSGEQQILVLAHEILFKATPGTLVLIDEPELSLHVLWQASFVEDLTQMGQVNSLSFLLATHSPTLIGGREDLKRSLDVLGEAY